MKVLHITHGTTDYIKRNLLISGHYGWPVFAEEYVQMKKDNELLCNSIAEKVKEIAQEYKSSNSFVHAPFSCGEVVIALDERFYPINVRKIITDKIIDIIGDRYYRWEYDGVALYVLFYGIDPMPYIKKWEKRTGLHKDDIYNLK